MKYRVEITDTAAADAEAAYLWIRSQSPDAADRWFNGLYAAIDSLETFPARCGLAPEAEDAEVEVRQLLYGRRPHVYRILLVIRGTTVFILHIRHGARLPLRPDELDRPPEDKS